MQSLPSIRLVQENDKSLVTKINSTLANTIPLWKKQLAQAITIYRSSQAAKTLQGGHRPYQRPLAQNAENLRDANAEIRTEIERGIFDIAAVKHANGDSSRRSRTASHRRRGQDQARRCRSRTSNAWSRS